MAKPFAPPLSQQESPVSSISLDSPASPIGSEEGESSGPRMWQRGDFALGPLLGRGSFARIRLVRELRSGALAVLKEVSKRRVARRKAQRCVARELRLQEQLRHDNILRLFGYFWDRSYINLILEYAPHGDVASLLRLRGPLEGAAPAVVRPVVSAGRYLHGLGVIHRDIKPENLLLGRKGTVKLADFGWAVQSRLGERRWTVCGTLDYLAPEMVAAAGHGLEVDLWSIGVLAFELVTGTPPFVSESHEETYKRILRASWTFPADVEPPARDFIWSLMQLEPSRRMGLETMEKHRWLNLGEGFWRRILEDVLASTAGSWTLRE